MACAAWVREGRVVCGASMHKCEEEEAKAIHQQVAHGQAAVTD